MLDLKLFRSNPELIQKTLKNRNLSLNVEEVIALDTKRRDILAEVEMQKKQRNEVSALISKGKLEATEKADAIKNTRVLGEEIKKKDEQLRLIEEELNQKLLYYPNILHESTPIGESEENNPLVKKWGVPREFSFPPQHHADLGAALDILDAPRGVKIAKTRFTLVKGLGARLERALISFMLDLHTEKHGYQEVFPPLLVSRDSMQGTGQLPKFEEDLFKTTEGLYLIPTAEVPVTNIYRDETIPEEALPIKFAAYTPCFRSEAGSYGKDTKGYIRQHQFNKVEMVKFCHPETSFAELEELLQNAEKVLQLLELPYRVIALCSGDIGFGAAKCYDIEVWLPSEKRYREISSCSNFTDFQARRANIKFKPKAGGKPSFVHTLNGSGLAVGRTVVAILENYQRQDGSIEIPQALVPYMGGVKEINLP